MFKLSKAQVNVVGSLTAVLVAVVILGASYIILGYQSDIQQDLRDDQNTSSTAYEIMDTGLNDTLDRSDDLSTTGNVIFAAIIISILITAFLGVILRQVGQG